jgi:hypothetical protein
MILCMLLSLLFLHDVSAADLKADAIRMNDDGSITLVKPHFFDGTVRHALAFQLSHPGAICKEFEFGKAVIKIAGKGKSEFGFLYTGIEKGTSGPALQSVVCSVAGTSQLTHVSNRYLEKRPIVNQSYEIIQPMFAGVRDQEIGLSTLSNRDGICHLYGYDRHVVDSVVLSKIRRSEKKLGLAVIEYSGNFSDIRLEDSKKIERIACQSPTRFQVRLKLSLTRVADSLKEIAFGLERIWNKTILDIAHTIEVRSPEEIKNWNLEILTFENAAEQLSPQMAFRLNLLLFLEPFFTRYSSEWFLEEVAPLYQIRRQEIQRLTGIQSIATIKKDRIGIEAALWIIDAGLRNLRFENDQIETIQWVNGALVQTGLYLASERTANDLQNWVNYWMTGESIRNQWLSSDYLGEIALLVTTAGEWVQSCRN